MSLNRFIVGTTQSGKMGARDHNSASSFVRNMEFFSLSNLQDFRILHV